MRTPSLSRIKRYKKTSLKIKRGKLLIESVDYTINMYSHQLQYVANEDEREAIEKAIQYHREEITEIKNYLNSLK